MRPSLAPKREINETMNSVQYPYQSSNHTTGKQALHIPVRCTVVYCANLAINDFQLIARPLLINQ